MLPSKSENYFEALQNTGRTVDSKLCPATAALEILIANDDKKSTRLPALSSCQKEHSSTKRRKSQDKLGLEFPSFPLIQWYAGEDASDRDLSDADAKPLAASLNNVQTDDKLPTTGKRSRSGLMSKSRTRLVRSVALNSHLSLLEASIQPLDEIRTVSERSCSATSLSQQFDVEKWLEVADHNDSSDIFASPTKMRKTMHRQESINTSMRGLALVT